MLLLILKSLPEFAWNDYFTATPVTVIDPKEYNSRQSPSDRNIYVSNCLFNEITSSRSGGALYCKSVTCLLIETSSFFSCTTSSDNGGAIYLFNSNNGECVLYEVCGNDCYSSFTGNGDSRGQFAHIFIGNSAISKNYVNYSSIARCVIDNYYSKHMLRLKYGKICCPSINISMNKCYIASGIFCQPFVDSNSVVCSLSYSSFADNTASADMCICFYSNGAQYKIKCCNIIRNTQNDLNSWGLIDADGNLMIEDSCILENTARYIFCQENSYTTTISNCTIDKTTNNGYLTILNTATKKFIHELHHMSTRNCHAEYVSVGTLTAIISVSPITEKTFCYKGKNLINRKYSAFLQINCNY
jgi:hypothetical protein